MSIELKIVKRTDPSYQDFRDRHYIPNRGCHGQQLHYNVMVDGRHVGIISGASSVYGCAPRDEFFGLSKTKEDKQSQLNQIVNNVVFRLEENTMNLGSFVLGAWRRRVCRDWKYVYGAHVVGFETFVIREDRPDGKDRHGGVYFADNWSMVGITQGNTKVHAADAKSGGMNTKHTRREVEKKLIFCFRNSKMKFSLTRYESSWKDKERAALVKARRDELMSAV
jgi:hypothetical protein